VAICRNSLRAQPIASSYNRWLVGGCFQKAKYTAQCTAQEGTVITLERCSRVAMASHFDWNTIPGVHSQNDGNYALNNVDTGNSNQVLQSNAPVTDHFDDFFNSQLSQNGTLQPPAMAGNGAFSSLPPNLQQVLSQPPPTGPNDGNTTNSTGQTQQPQQNQLHQLQPLNRLHDLGKSDTSITHSLNNLTLSPTRGRSYSDDTLDKMKSLKSSMTPSGIATGNSPLHRVMENPTYSSSTDTLIADNDSTIPLSLTIQDMSQKEVKTYLRWYENIQQRKNTSKVVTIDDVFNFMRNFKVPQQIKDRLKASFAKWAGSLNIGHFFALMRLLAHALYGKPLTRSLVMIVAPIPCPTPILSRKRKEDSTVNDPIEDAPPDPAEPKKKLDIDSFTEFILTGERPSSGPSRKKRLSSKKVMFSDVLSFSSSPNEMNDSNQTAGAVVTSPPQEHALDYSLPMNQLLAKLRGETVTPDQQQPQQQQQQQQEQQQQQQVPQMFQQLTENEEEELKDVQIDTFKNITQKAAQLNTVSDDGLVPLKPDLTGSASKSMKEHFMQQFEQTFNFNNATNTFNTAYPNIAALSANETGNTAQVSPPLKPDLPPRSFAPTAPTYPLVQNMTAAGSPNIQVQVQNTQGVVQPQQSTQTTDYFGMVQQQTQNVLRAFETGNREKPLQVPPVPPRSRASSSPPPVQPPMPPPPRSRKSSRATETYNSIPAPIPAPAPSQTAANGDYSHPALPPKPMLNEKQRKQFLSINDELNKPVGNTPQYPNMNGQNNLNVPGVPSMTNIQSLMSPAGQMSLHQLTPSPQLGQMGQMGQVPGGGGFHGNIAGQFNYQQQPQQGHQQNVGIGMSMGMYGGGWPPLQQQHQQPHQQQQQLQQSQMTGQRQTSPTPNWSGWQI
jgi:hypothetical protein